jgi:hypothetical protein
MRQDTVARDSKLGAGLRGNDGEEKLMLTQTFFCAGCGGEFRWWQNWHFIGTTTSLGKPISGRFYHKKCLPPRKS